MMKVGQKVAYTYVQCFAKSCAELYSTLFSKVYHTSPIQSRNNSIRRNSERWKVNLETLNKHETKHINLRQTTSFRYCIVSIQLPKQFPIVSHNYNTKFSNCQTFPQFRIWLYVFACGSILTVNLSVVGLVLHVFCSFFLFYRKLI